MKDKKTVRKTIVISKGTEQLISERLQVNGVKMSNFGSYINNLILDDLKKNLSSNDC